MKRSLKKQVFYPDTAAILSPTRSKDRGAAPLKEGERSERNERVFWWAVDATLGGGAGGSRWDTKALYSNNPGCGWSGSRMLAFVDVLFCTRQSCIVLITFWDSRFGADSGGRLGWQMCLGRLVFHWLHRRKSWKSIVHPSSHRCRNETIHNNAGAGGGTRRRGLHFSDSTGRK